MDKKTNGQKMADLLGWIRYDTDRVQIGLNDHDIDRIGVWFEELQKDMKKFGQVLEDAKRCIDYGEEWDQ